VLPAQPNQSLIDGVCCLQALAAADRAVGVRPLSRQLGLEATRVHRLLKTLAHLDLARQTPERRYTIGPAIHVLAAQTLFASGLIRSAAQPLRRLERLHLTVALGVLWRDQVSYLYHAPPGTPPAQALGRVGLFPATRSSIGMALLARQPREQVRRLFAGRGRSIPGYPGGAGDLRRDLDRIAARGYAQVRPSADGAIQSLAVPVGTPAFAAVACAGNLRGREETRLVAALRRAAADIAAALVQKPPTPPRK
jgi:DNA-binding IclR family transcriptional regulator